ncbi:MAG: DUF3108 domain-containing protein [bacterium]
MSRNVWSSGRKSLALAAGILLMAGTNSFALQPAVGDSLSRIPAGDLDSRLRVSTPDTEIALQSNVISTGPKSPAVPDYTTQTFRHLPFGVGERLRYHLNFSFVQAGSSEMAIVSIDTSTSQPSFHFRSRAHSTSTIDLVFKVRDQVDSWFDINSLYSHRYERRIREGGYKSLKFYDYDHKTGWVSISNENGPKGATPFEPFSHNIISALYWVRTQPLQAGVDLHLPLHDLNLQYPLTVKVYGKEKVKVPAGEWTCWKVEPVIESEGLFEMTGRLIVWLTDDELRLPVKMSSMISVGSIEGVLVNYRLGKEYTPENAPDYNKELDWDW